MTRNNSCQHVIDITGNILFETITLNGKPTAFLRLFGFVNPTAGACQVNGVRFIAYGPLAELIHAHVQRGSRLFIISHVQQRESNERTFTEFVIEECQFIRNINWEAGSAKRNELVARGELHPFAYRDLHTEQAGA
ncbi:MAG TPA: hypothetical protein PKG95_07795 [Anaerolineaceae bacterium]|jgi:hypothetical protein|nr:hypothetical protein [Anaerolineaceae bacterium]